MISTAPRPVTAESVATQTSAVVDGRMRITRRGRLVLVALVTALAFALVALGQGAASAGSADANGAPSSPVSNTWVVQPGETLWVIAERVDPEIDPRETVARIVAMNDLPNSSVQAGQELQIPA